MSADLHCHSKYSDGSTDVETIIKLAKLRGLSAISLTDHDTFMGVEKARFFGEKYDLYVVNGVEISSYDFDRNRLVHILCYNCKQPEKLYDVFNKTADNRNKSITSAMEKISRRFAIDMKMVKDIAKGSSSMFKSHIMKALMLAGYTDKMYGDLFSEIFGWKTGFARTKIEYPDVYEIIDCIHSAGGTAILAHPSVYDTIAAIPKLIKSGLDGIECNYPRGSEEIRKQLEEYVEKYNLLKTGGTDFHGYSCGKVNPIGTCTTSNEDLKKLMEYKGHN